MTNVHLFRDVGRGVVDDNRLESRLRNAQTIGGQRLLHLFSEKSRFEENIDKARAGDFNLAGDAAEIQMSQHLLCKLSGGHTQFFRNCHHAVGLIVAELNFG